MSGVTSASLHREVCMSMPILSLDIASLGVKIEKQPESELLNISFNFHIGRCSLTPSVPNALHNSSSISKICLL